MFSVDCPFRPDNAEFISFDTQRASLFAALRRDCIAVSSPIEVSVSRNCYLEFSCVKRIIFAAISFDFCAKKQSLDFSVRQAIFLHPFKTEWPFRHPRLFPPFNKMLQGFFLPIAVEHSHDATTDPDQIREWWGGKYKGANIGAACNRGFWALDVDKETFGYETLDKLKAEHGKLPETVTNLTGGGGCHYLFKHDGTQIKNGTNVAGPGLDVRSDGYIVLPPSIHPDTGAEYQWQTDKGPDDIEPNTGKIKERTFSHPRQACFNLKKSKFKKLT